MNKKLLNHCLFLILLSNTLIARNIYLNGTDISGVRSQDLKKVDIKIDDKGQIFIIAPSYQVETKSNYEPITAKTKYTAKSHPVHKKAGRIQNTAVKIPEGSDEDVKELKKAEPTIQTPKEVKENNAAKVK